MADDNKNAAEESLLPKETSNVHELSVVHFATVYSAWHAYPYVVLVYAAVLVYPRPTMP